MDDDDRTTLSDDDEEKEEEEEELLNEGSSPSGVMSTRNDASGFTTNDSRSATNANACAPGDGRNIAAGSLEDELVQDSFRFASWVFSAEDLPDLQVLTWWDFFYEGRYARHNLLLCKTESGYRTLTKADITY